MMADKLQLMLSAIYNHELIFFLPVSKLDILSPQIIFSNFYLQYCIRIIFMSLVKDKNNLFKFIYYYVKMIIKNT